MEYQFMKQPIWSLEDSQAPKEQLSMGYHRAIREAWWPLEMFYVFKPLCLLLILLLFFLCL